MGVGGVMTVDESANFDTSSKITRSVIITCIVAASSGLIFGYDVGISGGVTTMSPFLEKFFPEVLVNAAKAKTSIYCMYNSQTLTSFTSSLYLSALVASLVASRYTAIWGRKNAMVLGGCAFFVGSILNGAAANLGMLFVGRALLGVGVGFANHASPLYLSEMAPPKWRGGFNSTFQFFIAIGVIVAACINYGSSKHSWGWRLSLGFAAVPSTIMTIGALFISDTPSSLVERGQLENARKALITVRGDDADIDGELQYLVKYSEIAKSIRQEPFRTIFETRLRPHLVMVIAIPLFMQLTGLTIIAFYGPVIFRSVGFGSDSALMGGIILGLVNMVSNLVSIVTVDRFGRRFWLLEGGVQMFLAQLMVGVLLAAKEGTEGTKHISKSVGALVVTFMSVYGAGFGWSWGPIAWLIPSEILPMKIRTTGQSIFISILNGTTFILSQTFLSMLCSFSYGTFLFYAGWLAVMTVFIVFLLPETKGIPLDSMDQVWKQHWYWKRFTDHDILGRDSMRKDSSTKFKITPGDNLSADTVSNE